MVLTVKVKALYSTIIYLTFLNA